MLGEGGCGDKHGQQLLLGAKVKLLLGLVAVSSLCTAAEVSVHSVPLMP